jgi:hypothetical protein
VSPETDFVNGMIQFSIAKSTACERFLYRGGWGKLRWKASAITGTPTAYIDPSTPAIPLATLGARV